MTRSRILTTSTVAMVLGLWPMAACSSDESSGDPPLATPIAGVLTGDFGGEPCDGPGDEVSVRVSGKGEMGSLGTMQMSVDATAVCASTQGLDSVTDLTGTYTAENGDVLEFTGTGSAIVAGDGPAALTFTATDRFTGGTGQFAGATGQETVVYQHDFATGVITFVVEGEFTASD